MRISIITVAYNSAATIKETLASVCNQVYKNKEHIIIDGKSRDNTVKIIKNFNSKDIFMISEKDEGIYYAMNKGINFAKGDIIGILNSDDFYASNQVLSSVIKIFCENPLIDACYSDLVLVDPIKTSKIIRYWKSNQFKSGAFSKGWCPAHPTFFVRRSVYERFGVFNLNYHIASDVELMMRFLEVHKINTKYIPEIWVKQRVGGTSNKNLKNILKSNKEIIFALKYHALPINIFYFFICKLFSRTKQFFFKPAL
jgi:glycosyltransferase involved in cell wall biosynthesis